MLATSDLETIARQMQGAQDAGLCSARTLVRSRREPLKPIFMVEAAQNRVRGDPHVSWELMASDDRSREARRRFRQARTEACVRAATVIMELPDFEEPPQVRLPEWDQEV
jgi:hypothetical protein